jgi:hypothetical protein
MTGVTPVIGASSPPLQAELEGLPIDASEASAFYCHDFEFPVIRCFRTAARLEQAVGGEAGPSKTKASSMDVVVAAAFGPNDYVTIYSGPSYAAPYAHLSQNYDSLAVIGWNDMISSFKGRNNRRGIFREHWFGGGASFSFCCNQNVISLPAGIDNTFSSVYQT